jgi:formylglycine-generating enzyme required for sulfatase activity
MNYPSIEQYKDSIRLSEHTLKVLKDYIPVLRRDGELWFSSGNFAVVFKLKHRTTGREIALKCFTRHQEGRKQNFQKISECLKDYPSKYLVAYQYHDEELWAETGHEEGVEIPVLAMDWVDGLTLGDYVRQCCQTRNISALKSLFEEFKWFAFWLLSQPFAHGDLKPDNIIIQSDGKPVLLDYDGMYVPSMKGQKAQELGSPVYRHPRRTENDFNKRIDDFALVILLLELRILSLSPERLLSSGESLCLDQNDVSINALSRIASQIDINSTSSETSFWTSMLQHCESHLRRRSFNIDSLQNLIAQNLRSSPTELVVPPKVSVPDYIKPRLIFVKKGLFEMGDSMNDNLYAEEQPIHKVIVDSFFIASTTVTFIEYDLYCEAVGAQKPFDENWGRGYRPVINVTWTDAVRYCNWLSEIMGFRKAYEIAGNQINLIRNANGFRLPTEAEWEYAARMSGSNVRFGNGKNVATETDINCDFSIVKEKNEHYAKGGCKGQTVPVSTFPPNNLGLFEMSGNVWEWCNDWYGGYNDSFQSPALGPVKGTEKVIRGGSWDDFPWDCRCSVRHRFDPDTPTYDIGFRLVRTA